jgi:hypothetical protein
LRSKVIAPVGRTGIAKSSRAEADAAAGLEVEATDETGGALDGRIAEQSGQVSRPDSSRILRQFGQTIVDGMRTDSW